MKLTLFIFFCLCTFAVQISSNVVSVEHSTEYSVEHVTKHSTEHSTEQSTKHSTEQSTKHSTEHSTGHSTEHTTGHSTEHTTGHSTEHTTEHSAKHDDHLDSRLKTFFENAKKKFQSVLKRLENITVELRKKIVALVKERTIELNELYGQLKKKIDVFNKKGNKEHISHFFSKLKAVQEHVQSEVRKCLKISFESAEKHIRTYRESVSQAEIHLDQFMELVKSCSHSSPLLSAKCGHYKQELNKYEKLIENDVKTVYEKTSELSKNSYNEAAKCITKVYDSAYNVIKSLIANIEKQHSEEHSGDNSGDHESSEDKSNHQDFFKDFVGKASEKYTNAIETLESLIVKIQEKVTTVVDERTARLNSVLAKLEEQIRLLQKKGSLYTEFVKGFYSELKVVRERVQVEIKRCSSIAIESAKVYSHSVRDAVLSVKTHVSKLVKLVESCGHSNPFKTAKCTFEKRDELSEVVSYIGKDLKTVLGESEGHSSKHIYKQATTCVENVYEAAFNQIAELGKKIQKLYLKHKQN